MPDRSCRSEQRFVGGDVVLIPESVERVPIGEFSPPGRSPTQKSASFNGELVWKWRRLRHADRSSQIVVHGNVSTAAFWAPGYRTGHSRGLASLKLS